MTTPTVTISRFRVEVPGRLLDTHTGREFSFDAAHKYATEMLAALNAQPEKTCCGKDEFCPDCKPHIFAQPEQGERAEIIGRLLKYASDSGYSHVDYADTMRQAAALLQSETVVQKIMARLADLLDEDQFAEIESMAILAGVAPSIDPANQQSSKPEPAGELPNREYWIKAMCKEMSPCAKNHNYWRGWPGTYEFAASVFPLMQDYARAAIAPLQAEIERLKTSWSTMAKVAKQTADLNDSLALERDQAIAQSKQAIAQIEYDAQVLITERDQAIARSKQVPEGYALVPIEPTKEMLMALTPASEPLKRWRAYYRDMLAAAPQAAQLQALKPVCKDCGKSDAKDLIHTCSPQVAQPQASEPEIDCRQCMKYEYTANNGEHCIRMEQCTNGDKFTKLESVKLYRMVL